MAEPKRAGTLSRARTLTRVLAPIVVVTLSLVVGLIAPLPAFAAAPAALVFDGVNDQVVVPDATSLRWRQE